jgi:hypothetical protein
LLLTEPPSVDTGEITDKGYINQRAILARRVADLAALNDDASRRWIGCSRTGEFASTGLQAASAHAVAAI